MKPYILTFSDRLHFTPNLLPVHSALHKSPDFDSSLVGLKEQHMWGCRGSYDRVPHCGTLLRRPDAVVVPHAWWDQAFQVSLWARQHRIPVVAIEHGLTLFHQKPATVYRKDIGQASRSCIWGDHGVEVTKQYGPRAAVGCVVTGNPIHDRLHDFQPEPLALPKDFILCLGTWSVQKNSARHAANELAEHTAVAFRPHPNETHYPGRKPKRLIKPQVHLLSGEEDLFQLLYHSKAIVTTISSAMLPALAFEKPIFIVNSGQEGMDIGGFREEHGHLFNWGILELLKFCRGEECKVITAPKEAYEHFCGPADSHNTDRVIDVIKSLL